MIAFITGDKADKIYGYNLNNSDYLKLEEYLQKFIEDNNVDTIYTGLDLGVQTLAACAVIDMKEAGKNVSLTVCIPYNDQDIMWTSESRNLYREIIKRADNVIQLSNCDYSPELLNSRDYFMIDSSDLTVCVINTDKSTTKAAFNHILDYAEHQEKPVKTLDVGKGIGKIRKASKSKLNSSKITKNDITSWKNLSKFIAVDLETTGLSFESGAMITEIAAFKVDGTTVVEKYEQLVNPGQLIPANITEITGITDSMVRNKPSIYDVLPIFMNFVEDYTLVFHNSNFDYGKFIKPIHDRVSLEELNLPVLCTLKLDRFLRPKSKHKLADSYMYYLGKEFNNGHRAFSDALATAELAVAERQFVINNYNQIMNQLKE